MLPDAGRGFQTSSHPCNNLSLRLDQNLIGGAAKGRFAAELCHSCTPSCEQPPMWTEFRLQPLLRRLSAPGFGLALALSSALGGAGLTGCATEPKAEYSCFMSISTAPLTPGFGSPVRGTVTVLDASGSPTEVGTMIRVFVPTPPGVSVSGQARFADVSTDAVGVAAFTLSVDETVPVAPINVFAFIGESTEYCVAQQ